MKKCFIVLVVVAAFCAMSIPAYAETVFNEMSKCVQNFGKNCPPCGTKSSGADVTAPKIVKSVDALGNKVSLVTDNSGMNTLGR